MTQDAAIIEITATDPAWSGFVNASTEMNEFLIHTSEGASYLVSRQDAQRWNPGPIQPGTFHFLQDRLERLWPAGTGLSVEESAQLDSLIAGERGL